MSPRRACPISPDLGDGSLAQDIAIRTRDQFEHHLVTIANGPGMGIPDDQQALQGAAIGTYQPVFLAMKNRSGERASCSIQDFLDTTCGPSSLGALATSHRDQDMVARNGAAHRRRWNEDVSFTTWMIRSDESKPFSIDLDDPLAGIFQLRQTPATIGSLVESFLGFKLCQRRIEEASILAVDRERFGQLTCSESGTFGPCKKTGDSIDVSLWHKVDGSTITKVIP